MLAPGKLHKLLRCKEIAFDVKAVERVGGRTVGRGNGGCSWTKGFALPVVNAYVFQNEMYQNDRGLYTVDTLRLFINYDDVIRFIPTLDSQPDTHLKDRVEYRGQIYAPNRVFPKGQINIWCWPIGSGEMYGVRTNPKTAPEVRAAVTPRAQADKPVGQWNHFEITARGDTVTVTLNGVTVLPGATIPGLPARGRIALQHHGGQKNGRWNSPPSLVQFKNIYVKPLDR